MRNTAVLTPEELTGLASSHVEPLAGSSVALHRDVIAPFLALRSAAAAAGIELVAVSGYRDFARQAAIWNDKCRGRRPLLDREGRPLDASRLAAGPLIDAVLLWSALPGASRHHWGTDLDVIDAASLPPDYRVQLVPEEFAPGGPFARLDAWLARYSSEYGFERPYDIDRGGVQPEPWHLSHAVIAGQAMAALSVDVLAAAITGSGLEAEAEVLGRLPELHARYVCNVAPTFTG